jgi:hypothetical protein
VSTKSKRWTQEQSIAAARRWKRQTGEIPKSTDWRNGTDDHPAFHQVVVLWPTKDDVGGWNQMITAAGFTPRPATGNRNTRKVHKTRRSWSNPEDILTAIVEWKDRQGRWPTYMDWNNSDPKGHRPVAKIASKWFDNKPFDQVVELAKQRENTTPIAEVPKKPVPTQELVTPFVSEDPDRLLAIEKRLDKIERLMGTLPARMAMELKRAVKELTPPPPVVRHEVEKKRPLSGLFTIGR